MEKAILNIIKISNDISSLFSKIYNTFSKENFELIWNGDNYIQFIKLLNSYSPIINSEIKNLSLAIPQKLFKESISNTTLFTLDTINIDLDLNAVFSYNLENIKKLKKDILDSCSKTIELLDSYENTLIQGFENLSKSQIDSIYKDFQTSKKNISNITTEIEKNLITLLLLDNSIKIQKKQKIQPKTVSIIIPAYNAHQTLKRLLYSISIQDILDYIYLKVYIINDKSNHDYTEIIKPFKKNFDIQEFQLQKNSGPGYARQYGIEHSSEDYIVFMDSDDYFYSPVSLKILYTTMRNGNYDLVISKFLEEQYNNYDLKEEEFVWLHGKIFSREFITKNDIHFNNSRANEDGGFLFLFQLHNPKYISIDDITYIWANTPTSITRKNNRIYEYDCLKGFCYNKSWAANIAIEKNLNLREATLTILNSMVTMYYLYLEYYKKYDIEKILSWTKMLKDVYDKYSSLYSNQEVIDFYLKDYYEYYIKNKNKTITFFLSFDEFLKKVEEADDDRYIDSSL